MFTGCFVQRSTLVLLIVDIPVDMDYFLFHRCLRFFFRELMRYRPLL
jgi:hypothetical protein